MEIVKEGENCGEVIERGRETGACREGDCEKELVERRKRRRSIRRRRKKKRRRGMRKAESHTVWK